MTFNGRGTGADRTVERALGVSWTGGEWFRDACSTSSRAFGALEHLGDAIGDLAVGIVCWRNGLRATDAARLVANEHLDAVYHRLLEGLVHARSGDVIEAIVGAVHLERGFELAATTAVDLCAPHLTWEPLGDEPLDDLVAWPDATVPPWVGSLAIDAVIADVTIGVIGPEQTSQRQLNAVRTQVVVTDTLAASARRAGVPSHVTDRQAVALLRASIADTLVRGGWDCVRRLGARLLLPDLRVPVDGV